MAESLYDAAAQRSREEFYRLVSVNVSIATDEQLAKMRDSNKDAQPRAQMVVTWEPLSYRKEGGKYGNIETDYYPMSSAVSDEEIEQIRFGFWRGIPENKRMRIPQNLGQATRPWQRFMLKAKNAGLRIDIGEDGQFTSPDIGQVFKVEAGFDSFPQWQPNATGRGGRWTNPDKGESASTIYMRYPVARADDYVQPDDVPVRFVQSADDGDTTPAVTASAGGSGLTASAVAAAFAEAGMIGAPAADFSTAAQQINITGSAGSRAPILFSEQIQSAAQDGTLLDFAVGLGAISIEDGVIKAAA